MRRLFYRGRFREDTDSLVIGGADAHHLLHVLRAEVGRQLTVVDDDGQAALMDIVSCGAGSLTLRMAERIQTDTESPLDLTLVQCLLKGEKMDWVVQKAVELGVNRILPLAAANCVARYDAGKARQKQARWQKIADEAAKQCGRSRLTEVAPPTDWRSFLAGRPFPGEGRELYFCYENEQRQTLKDCLRQSGAKRLAVLIGPEGGFTPAEAEAVEAKGGRSVTLGPRILRAETAALAALSVLQYEKGDLG